MEAVLKRELLDIGAEILQVEDGKVTYSGDVTMFAKANIYLRTTERVLWKVGCFRAETFEELFQGTKNIPWEKYLPEDARFWVTKVNSIKSRLFSPSDIQSIMKKAMVDRMHEKYGIARFAETGAEYALRVTIMKDIVTVGIDTSGVSLHKRGYRKLVSKAPITETLAAAMILNTPWKADRILVDPFCGSGTIPIEAALIGLNIAPGVNRNFVCETWPGLNRKMFDDVRAQARASERRDITLSIQGFDIDGEIIKNARQNAKAAGVEEYIHFQQRPMQELSNPKKYGFIITNPPYGERLEEKSALPALYTDMGKTFGKLDTWSYFIITGYEEAQKFFGRQADKNRKIYNGMMKTYILSYMGPKPPKRAPESL